MKVKEKTLSPKLKALDTLSLKSMASGLRAMRHGQKSLLKLIEQEIASRDDDDRD